MIELDFSAGDRGTAQTVARGARSSAGVSSNLKDALGRRHGALQNVVLLAEILNRPEETQPVLQKRHHHAERESALLHAEPAIGKDERQRQLGDEFHRRDRTSRKP